MKGTEKQIRWAEDLKAKAIAALEWGRANIIGVDEDGNEDQETFNAGIDYQIDLINSIQNASDVINTFRFVKFDSAPDQVFTDVVFANNHRWGSRS